VQGVALLPPHWAGVMVIGGARIAGPMVLPPLMAVRNMCSFCLVTLLATVLIRGAAAVGATGAAGAGNSSRHNNNWAVLVRWCMWMYAYSRRTFVAIVVFWVHRAQGGEYINENAV